MRAGSEQDRPAEPAGSKAKTGRRTPDIREEEPRERLNELRATREKLPEQLNELEATERVLAHYSKGARGRKTAFARTPAVATKGETAKRTRSAPKAPGTQNEPQVSRPLPRVPEEYEVAADLDAILERLDQGIAAEHVAMDRLLERIVSRTPR